MFLKTTSEHYKYIFKYDLKQIKFSHVWSAFDPYGYATQEHRITRMNVIPINEMHAFSQDDWNIGFKNRIQMSDCNHRVVKTTTIDNWNNCIFIDIDYKKYVKENPNKVISPTIILYDVFSYMQQYFSHNLYYGELSRSNFGFHFIFYYDCERSQNSFEYYTRYTRRIVEFAFEQCNYSDIIHYNGVLDDCTKSFCQCCYLTRNEELFNEQCTGILFEYPYISVESVENKTIQHKTYTNNKYTFQVKHKDDTIQHVEYINHYERWRLFNSLAMLYVDDNELQTEWVRCAKMMQENYDHNTQYYINAPYTNDWYRRLQRNEYVDVDLLKQFGYTISITPKPTILIEDLMRFLKNYTQQQNK